MGQKTSCNALTSPWLRCSISHMKVLTVYGPVCLGMKRSRGVSLLPLKESGQFRVYGHAGNPETAHPEIFFTTAEKNCIPYLIT